MIFSPSVRVGYVGLGSNIEPDQNIPAAICLLSEILNITGISPFYRTPALLRPEQPDYLNGVLRIETDLSPREVKFDVLRRMEERLGRVRTEDRYATRTIDLDLLLLGDIALRESDIVLPDPDVLERPFLAKAILNLSPEIIWPGSDRRLADCVRAEHCESLVSDDSFAQRLRMRG